jgi:hypothetical protein
MTALPDLVFGGGMRQWRAVSRHYLNWPRFGLEPLGFPPVRRRW